MKWYSMRLNSIVAIYLWCGSIIKKAFDSVPHDLILKALELAQVPLKITNTIKSLMGTWATKLYLNSIETDIIKYQTGVLPEDCMALIVFVLSINPLLFILSKLPGYKAGAPGKRKNSISHLFFRDHLKMLICSRHPRREFTSWSHHNICKRYKHAIW